MTDTTRLIADLRAALEEAYEIASMLPGTRSMKADLADMFEEVDFLDAAISAEERQAVTGREER